MHLLDSATVYIKIIALFNKRLEQKYGLQRKRNYWYTSMPLVFTLAKKLNTRTVVTSRVGHVLSIHFGDNHVVWSEANYYYS